MKNKFADISPLSIFIILPLSLFLISTLFSVKTEIITGNIFFLSVGCYSLACLFKRDFTFRMPQGYMWSFFAYFVTLAVSMLWTENSDAGMIILRRELVWLGLPLCFCTFKLQEKEWTLLLNVFFRACLLFAIVSIGYWIYFSVNRNIDIAQFFIPVKHNIAGMYCYNIVYGWSNYQHPSYTALGLILGLIACQMLVRKKRIYYTEAVVYTLLLALIVYITQSRIGIVMFAAVIIVCPLFFFDNNRKYRLVYLIFVLLLGIAAVIAWLNITTPFSLDRARHHLYSDAITGIKNHPLLGVGLGGLPEAINDLKLSNPHNQLLGDWLQSGLLAVGALIVMQVLLLCKAFRDRNGELLLFIIVCLLFMQIEMPFYLIKGIYYFVLFACLFAARPITSNR